MPGCGVNIIEMSHDWNGDSTAPEQLSVTILKFGLLLTESTSQEYVIVEPNELSKLPITTCNPEAAPGTSGRGKGLMQAPPLEGRISIGERP